MSTKLFVGNLSFNTTENDLQDLRLILDISIRHVTALSLHYLNTNVGYILVFRSAVNVAFSSDDQHILSAFADQAAIAVTNARLFQTLVREKQHLAAIVEQSIDGVMILDGRWRITAFNRAMEHLTGWDRSEAYGRPCAEVVGKTCVASIARYNGHMWGAQPTQKAGLPHVMDAADTFRVVTRSNGMRQIIFLERLSMCAILHSNA